MRAAIVGGGVAGVAAAWSLSRAGADVTLLHDRPGASSLYSGALDRMYWEDRRPPDDEPLDAELQAFATVFEAWSIGPRARVVATHAGVVRPARGADTALLDLSALAGRNVAVVDGAIASWDARSLAASFGDSAWARRTKTTFTAVAVPGVAGPDEAHFAPFDLARLHDDPRRLEALGRSLASAAPDAAAFLLGPWLGTSPGVAERLSSLAGKPCGETTSPPGGPAGARFEAARDALLRNARVHVRREPVQAVEPRGGRLQVLASVKGSLTARDAGFDRVLLSTGGVASGGIELAGATFRTSVRVKVSLGQGGRALASAASLQGIDFVATGASALERVGILTEGSLAVGQSAIFVAGDAAEGRPRTALEAARAGILAAVAMSK